MDVLGAAGKLSKLLEEAAKKLKKPLKYLYVMRSMRAVA